MGSASAAHESASKPGCSARHATPQGSLEEGLQIASEAEQLVIDRVLMARASV
jgi:hypothetical protein